MRVESLLAIPNALLFWERQLRIKGDRYLTAKLIFDARTFILSYRHQFEDVIGAMVPSGLSISIYTCELKLIQSRGIDNLNMQVIIAWIALSWIDGPQISEKQG